MSTNSFTSTAARRDARISPETLLEHPMHAEAQRRASLISAEVQGSLRRLGVKVPANGRVNLYELDKVLAASSLTTTARMTLKTAMHQLKMLD